MTKEELHVHAQKLGVATSAIEKFRSEEMPKETLIELAVQVSPLHLWAGRVRVHAERSRDKLCAFVVK